jgi:putative ABC transport system substrate-binding protein
VTAALQSETRTIPIVFVLVSDPVGAGFVASLPRPGANITGFINLEASMSGKWVDLLTEIAPRVRRVAIMFNPNTAPGGGTYFLPSFWAACHAHAVESITAPVRDDTDIERVITGLGREAGGGLIVQPDGNLLVHREMILSLAARNKVPAIYPLRVWAKEGGLLSYGWDSRDLFRQAAPYVDRILREEKPSDLPVQVPTKFELVINRKVGDALGISIPPLFYILADEVIE